jgi:hypothetical protein
MYLLWELAETTTGSQKSQDLPTAAGKPEKPVM